VAGDGSISALEPGGQTADMFASSLLDSDVIVIGNRAGDAFVARVNG
jgi:hypothetical protein